MAGKTYDTLIFDRKDPEGTVRLTYPVRINAVIAEMYNDLQTVFKVARDNAGIRAMIPTGTVWKRRDGDKQAFFKACSKRGRAAAGNVVQQQETRSSP